MLPKGFECPVSKLVGSDARPRPTAHLRVAHPHCADLGSGRIVASEVEAPNRFANLV